MYSDIIQVKAQQEEFSNWRQEEDKKRGIPILPLSQFTVDVLSSSNWPYYHPIEPKIPSELKECLVIYTEFWTQKNTHKRLNWMHLAGTFNLIYNKGKTNEIVCGTLQGLVLLLFNNSDSITFKTICENLGVDSKQGQKILNSLMAPQSLIEKAGTDWTEDTEFHLNEKFASPVRKIHLPQPEESENIQKNKVTMDRGVAIEAGIVKVMKARKVLEYNDLIKELIKVLPTFVPNTNMIKDKIEELISKDYLVRDENNPKIYKYVAN